ncbi:hypothetical protein ABZ897_47460 [Nonomuraea sp. NPDC046802]|uniref:RraA family protein n=1 Tax=Nonomuraea sp. NPDC046802 TaxID=3154919 RepID=UPI00340AD982
MSANELAEAGVATVYEARGRRGLVDESFEPLLPGRAIAGPARTALCGQDDNRAVHEVMAHVRPGDVLVLTMPEPRPVALLGDLLATQALARGAAAVLVDAAVRDVADLRELGLPVWTRWRRVKGADKNVRGAVNVPVTVGGATIDPGDLVVLDDDRATGAAPHRALKKPSGLRASMTLTSSAPSDVRREPAAGPATFAPPAGPGPRRAGR